MSVLLLYSDLRDNRTILEKTEVLWHSGMTAAEVLEAALVMELSQQIVEDVARDNPSITVSCINLRTDLHSNIGGVGSLDWQIENNSILAVTYEDETTTEQQIDASSNWMLNIYDTYSRSC